MHSKQQSRYWHPCRPPVLEVLESRWLPSAYTLTDLGTLPGAIDTHPTALNNLGQVVGYANGPSIDRAFLWDGGKMTTLDTLGGDNNEAYAINDLGQVTGRSDVSPGDPYTHHAFLWGSVNGMQDLWNFDVFFSESGALNNAGEVLGRYPLDGHSYVWNMNDGQVTDLCPKDRYCNASSINNLGQVAGSKVFDFDEHAALRNADGSWQDLGTLSGPGTSYAYSLNDVGQVVGGDFTINHAFLWQDGVMTDLGDGTVAECVNNAGQIVGGDFVGHAVIWHDSVMTDLNTLVPGGSGLTLYNAKAINDAGQIMVEALDADRHFHAVVLTPDCGGAAHAGDASVMRLSAFVPEAATIIPMTLPAAARAPALAIPAEASPSPTDGATASQTTETVLAIGHWADIPAPQDDQVVGELALFPTAHV